MSHDAILNQAILFDVPGHAVIATLTDGCIVFWNEHAGSLFGWTREEVVGRNILEVTPAAGAAERAEEIMAKLRVGETWTGEFVLRTKNGTDFTAFVTDLPVRDTDGNLIGIVGVTRRTDDG